MNGGNSNTKGSNVGNVGFWARGLLPAVINSLGAVLNSLKGIQSGAVLPASVDFVGKAGSDRIADDTLDEICRRLVVTVEKQDPGNVLYQPLEPNDHTKAWWKTDPVTNLPIAGELRQWVEKSASWERVQNTGVYVPPKRRSGILVSPAGLSTINFAFQEIATTDYISTLTPTLRGTGEGSWNTPPSSFPAGFGYAISNKTSNSLSVAFFGIPTGGLTWEVDIEERQTTTA